MRAVQYLDVNHVDITEVDKPTVETGQALVRVTAAGLCQSDVGVRAAQEPMIPFGVVLGHEVAGTVVEVADDVTNVSVGEQVIMHPVWSCGSCRQCIAGRENACVGTGDRMLPPPTPGVTVNGGLAEFIAVPASALVPAEGLDPAVAAVLPDAGLVPYHSINAARDVLRPGSTAAVIGIGGLGQFAVRMLREITGVRVIALDVKEDALSAVLDTVDHAFLATEDSVSSRVLEASGGYGADFVLDLVGTSRSLKLAGSIVAPYGAIRVPGLSGGTFEFETSQVSTSLPWGASLTRPYSGTHQDLHDMVALVRTKRFRQ